jgi:hypothetical protein
MDLINGENMKPSSAKSKGRRLQQHIRDRIYHHFPQLREGDVESRPMGSGGVDLMMSPAARECLPLSIEAKNTVSVPGSTAIEQSKYNAYKDTLPVVAWKPKGKQYVKTLVICEMETFIEFWKNYQKCVKCDKGEME